jgi:hypothetical protein
VCGKDRVSDEDKATHTKIPFFFSFFLRLSSEMLFYYFFQSFFLRELDSAQPCQRSNLGIILKNSLIYSRGFAKKGNQKGDDIGENRQVHTCY